MDENSFILPYYYIIMLGIFYIIQANFELESLGGKNLNLCIYFQVETKELSYCEVCKREALQPILRVIIIKNELNFFQ